jgi:uncharacterized protein YndB with AHSA1/START domain
MPGAEIRLETKVAAEPAEVYQMFTNSTYLRYWLADVAISSPRPEGRLYLGWNDGYQTVGSYGKLDPGRRVSFGWHGSGDPGPSKVDIRIGPVEGGSLVRLRHWGFGDTRGARKAAKSLKKAWTAALDNLTSVTESGADLRITRRPLLGIFVAGEVTPERQDEFGVDHGVRLGGVAVGLGAAGAGLRENDVITRVGGRMVRGFDDLRAVVSEYRAGDTIDVEYVRSAEVRQAVMELSGRQYGPLPATARELAATVEQTHQRFLVGLEEALTGITEEEAWRPPGEEQWSVREVLAHLIEGEIDGHALLVAQLEGVEPYYDGTFGNSNLRVHTGAASYPDIRSMVDACRRALTQTVLLLTALPEPVVARKPAFWRIAIGFGDLESHLTEHLEQIKAARADSGGE